MPNLESRVFLLGVVLVIESLLVGCSRQLPIELINESQFAELTRDFGQVCTVPGDDPISLSQIAGILWVRGVDVRIHGSFVWGVAVDRARVSECQSLLEGDVTWGELSERIRLTQRTHPGITRTTLEQRLRRTRPIIEKRPVLDAVRDLGPDLSLARHVLSESHLTARMLKDGLLTLVVIPRGGTSESRESIAGCEMLVLLERPDSKDSEEWIGQVYREGDQVHVRASSHSTLGHDGN